MQNISVELRNTKTDNLTGILSHTEETTCISLRTISNVPSICISEILMHTILFNLLKLLNKELLSLVTDDSIVCDICNYSGIIMNFI